VRVVGETQAPLEQRWPLPQSLPSGTLAAAAQVVRVKVASHDVWYVLQGSAEAGVQAWPATHELCGEPFEPPQANRLENKTETDKTLPGIVMRRDPLTAARETTPP
jgi:hypothetical protein